MGKLQTFADLPFGAYFIVFRSDNKVGNEFNANRTKTGTEIYRKLPAGRTLTMEQLDNIDTLWDTVKSDKYSAYSPFTAGDAAVQSIEFSDDTIVIRIDDTIIHLFSLMDISRIIDWIEIIGNELPNFPTLPVSFSDLPENGFFIVPDQNDSRKLDGDGHKANIYQKRSKYDIDGQIYSHEKAEGFDFNRDVRLFYAANLNSMHGTTEISESINNNTMVIQLHPNLFSYFHQISSPPEKIGPKVTKRPQDFFKAGDLV